MTVTKQISLEEIISAKSKAYIDGTKLRGGTTIEEIKVNYPIGNALRKLRHKQVSFFEANIELEMLSMDAEGYLFRKKDGNDEKEIFLQWNKQKKALSNVIFKESVDNYSNEDIIQSIILLEMAEDLTGMNTSTLTNHLLTDTEIEKETETAKTFANVVSKIEGAILDNILSINNISFDEYSFEEDELEPVLVKELDVISLNAEEDKDSEEVQNEIEEEKEPNVNTSAILNDSQNGEEETTVEKSPKEMQQVSLFSDIPGVQSIAEISNKQTTRRKSQNNKKNEEKTLKVVKPKLSREEALLKRPRVEDDAWALEKLKSFDVSEKFINQCIEFRQRQRKVLTPEQIMLIPTNGKYTGWTEPVKRGIAAFWTRKNLIVRGETSTGKTTLIKTICSLLNYPMTFAGGSMDASLETFIGINTLEDGTVGVKNAPLITAMINGGIFYLDEGNSVLPGVLIQIHSAMDDERMIFNQLTGEEIKAHPNFRFATCINDGYEGTNEMNDATMDRLVAIETKYMKPEDMKRYYENFPAEYTDFQKQVLKMENVSEDEVLEIVEIAKTLQMAASQGDIPEKVASQRNIDALLELSRVLDMKEAIIMIIQKYPKEERSSIAAVFSQVESLNITAEQLLAI